MVRSAPTATRTRRPPAIRPRPAGPTRRLSTASQPVELRLLGGFDVQCAGAPCPGLESRKLRLLLAFLALARGQAIPRDRLAGLLWPDHGDARAHQNLRQALYDLHAALGDRAQRLVAATTLDVGVPAEAPLWVDVAELEQSLARARPAGPSATAELEAAVRLYRGEFLAGLAAGREELEDWLDTERERLRDLVVGALLTLLASFAAAGTAEEEIRYAHRLLEIDPLCEAAHLHLVAGLARSGRRGSGLAHFERLRRRLDEELGCEPSPQALALQRAIQLGELGGGASGARGGQVAPGELIVPFVGQEEAWRALERAWADVRRGHPRRTTISGPPGSGRTRLARTFLGKRCAADRAIVLSGQAAADGWECRFEPLLAALASLPAEDLGLSGPLRAHLTELALRLPGLCGRRPDLPCPRLPPRASTDEAAQAIAEFLVALAEDGRAGARRPIVFLLEDVDPGDEALAEALDRLLELAARPVWFLTTTADIRATGHDIRLGNLSADEVRGIATAVLPAPEAGALADALLRTSAGLPLAVAESLNLLVDAGILAPTAAGGWRSTGPVTSVLRPSSLGDLIARRVALLPTECRRLLTLAAVTGDPFSAALLQAADGEDLRIVVAALDILLARRFVRPRLASWIPARRERDRDLWAAGQGSFEIAHRAIREQICARLQPARRRALHRQAADALTQVVGACSAPALFRLARHLTEARDREGALAALARAEEWARATGDAVGAARLADHARRVRGFLIRRA